VFSKADDLLTSLVTNGKYKIGDFLKEMSDMIIKTFFRLAVVNPILNGLFGSSKGFSLLPDFWGSGIPAKADGGPGRGLTLVGERGPELINMGSGSSVIPNHLLRGNGGGDVYQIDARGADEARIQGLENMLRTMNATIERRSVGANLSARMRRQIPG
jgi:hypothetical protein